MKPIQKIKVEKVFTDFVKSEGGESLDEKFKGIPNIQSNADYLFSQYNIIAELKCLEVDSLNSNSGQDRMLHSIIKHIKNGNLSKNQITEWLSKNELPELSYGDLCNDVRKTIDTAIKKANKQISSTKILLSEPESRGLVFLVNDGNLTLSPSQMLNIINNLMSSKYMKSSIDGFVYFNVNFPATHEATNRKTFYWLSRLREENSNLVSFISQLGKSWAVFLSKINNTSEIPQITGSDAISYLKKIKHI